MNRNTDGKYTSKKIPLIILGVIVATAFTAPAIASQVRGETVIVPQEKKIDLNAELNALIEKRTQDAMKDPANIKLYHDEIYSRETSAINILTSKI